MLGSVNITNINRIVTFSEVNWLKNGNVSLFFLKLVNIGL